MSRVHPDASRRRAAGATLVELVIFIVLVSVAAAGVLMVISQSTRQSAEPLVRKQALAVAEALLEEARLMPYTFCDPNDPAVTTAASAAACAQAEALGPEVGEVRGSALTPFDNVNDYNGLAMAAGITDFTGVAVNGLGAYQATVTVTPFAAALNGVPAAELLRITVSVTAPGIASPVVLDGVRARYAPNL